MPVGKKCKVCYLPEKNHTDPMLWRGCRDPWAARDPSQQTLSCRAECCTDASLWTANRALCFQSLPELAQAAPCLWCLHPWWHVELEAGEMLQGSQSFTVGLLLCLPLNFSLWCVGGTLRIKSAVIRFCSCTSEAELFWAKCPPCRSRYSIYHNEVRCQLYFLFLLLWCNMV